MQGFQINHVWKYAREHALSRVSPAACIRCSNPFRLEVNHIVPLNGDPRTESCFHHQTNLEVLCHDCHVDATNQQRRDGFFQRRP
jgi:5-methylcytosine-specific restriction endonuclease McrA